MGTIATDADAHLTMPPSSRRRDENEQAHSEVVHLAEVETGVGEITMQDTTTKNSFSPGMINGLIHSFRRVAQDERFKVVILTGYGHYFLSGGSKNELLRLQS